MKMYRYDPVCVYICTYVTYMYHQFTKDHGIRLNTQYIILHLNAKNCSVQQNLLTFVTLKFEDCMV